MLYMPLPDHVRSSDENRHAKHALLVRLSLNVRLWVPLAGPGHRGRLMKRGPPVSSFVHQAASALAAQSCRQWHPRAACHFRSDGPLQILHGSLADRTIGTAIGVGMLLRQLRAHKLRHKTESEYQVWQEGSHPEQIQSDEMMWQKLEYVHNNPVARGYVDDPVHWRYSSARNYARFAGVDRCRHGLAVENRWTRSGVRRRRMRSQAGAWERGEEGIDEQSAACLGQGESADAPTRNCCGDRGCLRDRLRCLAGLGGDSLIKKWRGRAGDRGGLPVERRRRGADVERRADRVRTGCDPAKRVCGRCGEECVQPKVAVRCGPAANRR